MKYISALAIWAMQPWGQALEQLRGKGLPGEISIAELSRRVKRKRHQYTAMCRSKLGPSIKNMDLYLRAMNKTWEQWAEVYGHVTRAMALRELQVHPSHVHKKGAAATSALDAPVRRREPRQNV